MEVNKIYNEDCIKGMERIGDKSIDFILTDLPYGVTDCEWDNIIPFPSLWEQYNRIIKDDGTIALFSIQPFTTKVIKSNMKNFKYCWYWKKNNKTGFTFAKFQPMRCIEDICIFYADKGNKGKHLETRKYLYDELKRSGLKRKDVDELLKNSMSSHYFTMGEQFTLPSKKDYEKLQTTGHFKKPYEELKKGMKKETGSGHKYNPQGLKAVENPKVKQHKDTGKDSVYKWRTLTKAHAQKFTNYPVHVLEFKNEAATNKNRLHPTQKPVALCEYLIKTYTDAGDVVLDSCTGSGTTLVAAKNTGRNYIGFETDVNYYNIAVERLLNVGIKCDDTQP